MFSPSDFPLLWNAVVDGVRATGDLSNTALDYWFGNMHIELIDGDLLLLSADNDIIKKVVTEKYFSQLTKAVADVMGEGIQIEITVQRPDVVLEGEGRVISPLRRAEEIAAEEEAARQKEAAQREAVRHASERRLTYNPEYTFDNFIVGSSNRIAYSAAKAVANNPASAYNPLFIYGPSGIGKTHLMYAITNKLLAEMPTMNAIYIGGEDFTIQLIDAIEKKQTAAFREKYRKVDILLIDDIQFIAGKEATQEEFFHTFNALYQEKKQIILTSDRPPKEMTTLQDRIKTRFEQGLLVDIQLPDYELRRAILKNKAASIDLPVSDEVLGYIAEKLRSSIRQLEGIVKRMSATHLLDGAKVDMELARTLVPMFQQETEPVGETAEKIIEAVAKRYSVTAEEILGDKRTKTIKDARNLSMYIIRQVTELSLPAIGTMFNRDHSTVHSNITAVEKALKTDTSLSHEIADVRREIKR